MRTIRISSHSLATQKQKHFTPNLRQSSWLVMCAPNCFVCLFLSLLLFDLRPFFNFSTKNGGCSLTGASSLSVWNIACCIWNGHFETDARNRFIRTAIPSRRPCEIMLGRTSGTTRLTQPMCQHLYFPVGGCDWLNYRRCLTRPVFNFLPVRLPWRWENRCQKVWKLWCYNGPSPTQVGTRDVYVSDAKTRCPGTAVNA